MKDPQTTSKSTKDNEKDIKEEQNNTMTVKNKTKKEVMIVTIVDFISEPTKRNVINSPKSIYCIKKNGFEQEDIVFVPFVDFCNNHPETITMNKDEKRLRYDFYENLRQSKIEKITKERDYIIQCEENYEQQQQQEEQNKNSTTNNFYMTQSQSQMQRNGYQTQSKNHSQNHSQYNSRPRSLDNKQKNNTSPEHSDEEPNDEEIETMKKVNQKKISKILEYEIQKDELLSSTAIPKEMIAKGERSRVGTGGTRQSIEMDQKYLDYLTTQYKIKNKQQINSAKKQNEQQMKDLRNKKKIEINQRNQENNQAKEELRKRGIKNIIIKKEMDSYKIFNQNNEKHREKIENNTTKTIMMADNIKQGNRLEEQRRQDQMYEIMQKQERYEKNKENLKTTKENRMKKIQDIQEQQLKDMEKLNQILKKGVNDNTIKEIQTYFYDNDDVINATNEYYSNKEEKQKAKEQQEKEKADNKKDETKTDNQEQKNDDNKDDTEKKETIDKDTNKTEHNNNEEEKKKTIEEDEGEEKKQEKEGNEEPKILTEEEILGKTKYYRIQLNRNFLKAIALEKDNEKIREERLLRETNKYEKEKLEKQYGKERTMSNYRLSLKNDEITFKVREYEKNLRKQSNLPPKSLD